MSVDDGQRSVETLLEITVNTKAGYMRGRNECTGAQLGPVRDRYGFESRPYVNLQTTML